MLYYVAEHRTIPMMMADLGLHLTWFVFFGFSITVSILTVTRGEDLANGYLNVMCEGTMG
jgi:hypothetical protein